MRSIKMTRHHKSNNVYNILKQIIKSEFLLRNTYLIYLYIHKIKNAV